MRYRNKAFCILIGIGLLCILSACTVESASKRTDVSETERLGTTETALETKEGAVQESRLYIYGEEHNQPEQLDMQLEIWDELYHKHGVRHMFIERPYYVSEFFNMWMQAEDDTFLHMVTDEWIRNDSPSLYHDYFKTFKEKYPETVFHGTDVGMQYASIGVKYFDHMYENGLQDTPAYERATDVLIQGIRFFRNTPEHDSAYRETQMAENIRWSFNQLDGESVMGIYGSGHASPKGMTAHGRGPNMANYLKDTYGDRLATQTLSEVINGRSKDERITLSGKAYDTTYYGKVALPASDVYKHRKFWRVEDAFEDLKEAPATEDTLIYTDYPMPIESGQVFMVQSLKKDWTIETAYYRSSGNAWTNHLETESFITESE